MAAIINKPGFGEILGQNLGTGLGQGLQSGVNSGLNLLINQRMNDLAQRNLQQRLQSGLQPIFGEQADQYSNLPLELLKPAVTEKLKSSQRLESTGPGFKLIAPGLSNEQAEKIGSLPPGVQQIWYRSYIDNPKAAKEALNQATPQELAQLRSMPQQQLPIQEQEQFGDLQQMVQPQNRLQALQPKQKPSLQEQLLGSLPGLASGIGTGFGVPQSKTPTPNEAYQTQVLPTEDVQPKSLEEVQDETKIPTVLQLMRDEGLGKKEAEAEVGLRRKEYNESVKTSNTYKHSLEALHDVNDESNLFIKRMKHLIDKEGGLPVSYLYSLYKKLEETGPGAGAQAFGTLGGVIGGALGAGTGSAAGPVGTLAGAVAGGTRGAALGATIGGLISPIAQGFQYAQRGFSPNTEEFEKMSNNFIKFAKGVFGARITDADLRAFMATIPTLANTDHGKRAIIRNMETFMKANEIKYKAMREILSKNKGRVPPNLQSIVADRTKDQLDKLADQFSTGL